MADLKSLPGILHDLCYHECVWHQSPLQSPSLRGQYPAPAALARGLSVTHLESERIPTTRRSLRALLGSGGWLGTPRSSCLGWSASPANSGHAAGGPLRPAEAAVICPEAGSAHDSP